MEYQILSNKWRPQNFDQIIGHKYIIRILKNSLDLKRIHQSWLFSGIHGIGKTTIARILAKSLNCENGITSKPCRVCKNCISIEKGNFLDFIELDAASKTKVEDIKIILDSTKYPPIQGRFKIYLIDEIHMLSKNSFNALLKILEEPPKYIKFILATTHLKKIPNTIISRCLHIHLPTITNKNISNYLRDKLKKENIQINQEILNIISNSAQGSIRNAINSLELALCSTTKNKINIKKITKLLGIFNKKNILLLAVNIINNNIDNTLKIIDDAEQKGIQHNNIILSLITFFHNLSIVKITTLKKKYSIDNLSKYDKIIYVLSKRILFKDIQIYCKILIQGEKYLRYAPNPKIGIEIILFQIYQYIQDKTRLIK
ncbi:DNA polymerase III subunit tau, isoform gamma [Buchnera aphidicola (Cinara kochiana kochiana)]|uniref:DNA polymerase III subunit gamma/tau n=1 Tax=Buchnera aphidicola (Cinara kochiana kochiana) TaxID=2518976 RepID=A0A451D5X7_9GAMM|nr:DNA polymerase III subunit gamma/tau [Buchnera aphidicola]VFP81212.1 DNA polymerase III subunit tau, isoform gamma [Buchnera aphidicola (Cinara kochiana kochiana)]